MKIKDVLPSLLSSILLLMPPPLRSDCNGDIFGFVVEVTGGWVMYSDGKQVPIVRGMALSAGCLIRFQQRFHTNKRGVVEVALFDGSTQSCDVSRRCHKLTVREPTVKNRGFLDRLRMAVARLASNPPDRYVSALSRGNSDKLTESVLPIVHGRVDLRPLKGDLKKSLRILLQRSATQNGKIEWRSVREVSLYNENSIALAEGLTTGLYRAVEIERGEPTGVDAWLLLVDEKQYESAYASFKYAEDIAHRWYSGFGYSPAIQGFLRSYLEVLADSLDRSVPAYE